MNIFKFLPSWTIFRNSHSVFRFAIRRLLQSLEFSSIKYSHRLVHLAGSSLIKALISRVRFSKSYVGCYRSKRYVPCHIIPVARGCWNESIVRSILCSQSGEEITERSGLVGTGYPRWWLPTKHPNTRRPVLIQTFWNSDEKTACPWILSWEILQISRIVLFQALSSSPAILCGIIIYTSIFADPRNGNFLHRSPRCKKTSPGRELFDPRGPLDKAFVVHVEKLKLHEARSVKDLHSNRKPSEASVSLVRDDRCSLLTGTPAEYILIWVVPPEFLERNAELVAKCSCATEGYVFTWILFTILILKRLHAVFARR